MLVRYVSFPDIVVVYVSSIFQAALPPMMGDLLEYFETRNHSLDKVEVNHSLCLDSKFTSNITINGVPILPPVVNTIRGLKSLPPPC